MRQPEPPTPDARSQLSSAMIVAHARAKARPGSWAKADAHYQCVLAWKYEESGRHTVALQGTYLTPDVTHREWFEELLPPSLKVVSMKEVKEKRQIWFLLESEPVLETPLAVPPGTPRLGRAGDHLPPMRHA